MKILLITFSNNADHQDIVLGLFEQLQTKCDTWLVITDCPKVFMSQSPHIKQVKCPQRPGICKQTFNLKSLLSIMKWVRKQRFDIVFFETLHTWNLPIMLFCSKRCRVFQMIHDLVPHQGDKSEKAVLLMNRAVCKLVTDIVLPNQKFKDLAAQTYNIPIEHVKYIDLCRRFPPYTPPAFKKKVLFFGRINPYKGIDLLLNIVRKCPEIEFHIVGRVDSSMAVLAQQIATEPNVISNYGYVTNQEMETAFTSADWVVLPYRSATQSGVVIDSYRYSRPVIAFDVGAISEQVCVGSTGFLVTEGDCIAFSQTLKRAMQLPPTEYEKFCKRSYDFGLQKYGGQHVLSRFMALLDA